MWQRTGLWLGLCSFLVGAAGCNDVGGNNYNTGTPTPTAVPNHRPTAVLLGHDGSSENISLTYIVEDNDSDPISVTFQYSNDGGKLFKACSPAAGSSNPTTGLTTTASDQTETFVWDSASDLGGENLVTLRLVPSDGQQEGEGYVSSEFSITNPVLGDDDDSTGDDDSSGNPGDDDDTTPPPSVLDEEGGGEDVTFDEDGAAEVDLNEYPESGRDNTAEEYLFIVANTGSDASAFTLDTAQDTSSSAGDRSGEQAGLSAGGRGAHLRHVGNTGRGGRSHARGPAESSFRKKLHTWSRGHRGYSQSLAPEAAPQADYVVGETQGVYKVIASLSDSGKYSTVNAVLGAVGQGVLIFVDKDIPIGIDTDCSDLIPPKPDLQGRDTYGFDTCDLAEVANIFDQNILPHLHTYFGNESDVDGNQKITVLLTPVLNLLTADSESTDQVQVYADPEVDLNEYDAKSNPGSNYQEIIYLAAPDPAGYYNPNTGGGGESAIDQYVTVKTGANIAIATQSLISYNTHVLQNDGDIEEDWLNDGLGLLAADLTGFGSIIYDDVVYYLDAPYLYSLTAANSLQDVDDRGVQYLFCRYLIDVYGTDILAKLLNSPNVGTDNVEGVLEQVDPGKTFDNFWISFLEAISLEGAKNSEGGPLVPDLQRFNAAQTVDPDSQDYYGAQGYQIGININGLNYARSRASDGSLEVTEYRLHGADWNAYATGVDFYGYVAGGYSGQFVRVGGLIAADTLLTVSSDGGSLQGQVVRLKDIDPEKPTFVIEQVFGTLASDIIPMEVFEDGTTSIAFGDVDKAQELKLADGSQVPVEDTDLYGIDLSDFSASSTRVYIELDRSISTASGSATLQKVLFSVVPEGDLPRPTTVFGSYVCDDKVVKVSYPSSFLPYLTYQYVLTPTAGQNPSYSPEGVVSEDPTTCNFDYNSEVSRKATLQNDSDEPMPTTLIDQIWTYQVQYLGGKSTIDGFYPYNSDFMDLESLDSDNTPSYDFAGGLGGRNVDDGEEAWAAVDLPSGQPEDKYIIVVAGPGSTGPYTLSTRVLDY